jgi:hypothetical protein
MKKLLALLAVASFVSLTVLAEEPAKTCDKKEGKSCCKKEASAKSEKASCCSKDAKNTKSCSKDEKSSCSKDKAEASKPAGCSHGDGHGHAEVKSDK